MAIPFPEWVWTWEHFLYTTHECQLITFAAFSAKDNQPIDNFFTKLNFRPLKITWNI